MVEEINDIFYFLNDDERKKICKKYENSSMNKEEIIKEICKEYNLDYKKTIRRTNLDKDITNISRLISNFIRELIKIFRKSVLNKSLESFLETIVKIIVFVIIVMIFKIPFIAVEYLVKYVNNTLFYPFNYSINYISKLLVSLVYMLVCITWGLKLFGNYRGIDKKKVDISKIENVDSEYKYLDKIIRIIIYLIVLIPLFLLLILNIIFIILSLYLVFTGVNIIGVPIIFIGISMLLVSVIKIFKDSLNRNKDTRLLSISISILVLLVGCGFTYYNISNFKMPSDLKDSNMTNITESIELKLDDLNTKVLVSNGKYDLIADNSLQDNNIRIEVTYYDNYVDILYGQEKIDDINYLTLRPVKDDYVNYNNLFKDIHKDLKRGYIFDYSNLRKISVKVFANEEVINTMEKKSE